MKMATGAVITAGLAFVGALGLLKAFLNSKKENPHAKLAPRAIFNEFGNLKELESFGDYFGTIFSHAVRWLLLMLLPSRCELFAFVERSDAVLEAFDSGVLKCSCDRMWWN